VGYLEDKRSVNWIAKRLGKSWNYVDRISQEFLVTGSVTLYDFGNPYHITKEGREWVGQYYVNESHTGNSTKELVFDYEKHWTGRKIELQDVRKIVKKAGFRFYRSTWVKPPKYKAPPTKAELANGARLWISLFNSNTHVVTFDEFEIDPRPVPYSFWAKASQYTKLMDIKPDGKRYFVQAAIDLAGTVAYNIFEGTISTTEKAQFINEVSRIFHNLIDNEDELET
jgi:transposase